MSVIPVVSLNKSGGPAERWEEPGVISSNLNRRNPRSVWIQTESSEATTMFEGGLVIRGANNLWPTASTCCRLSAPGPLLWPINQRVPSRFFANFVTPYTRMLVAANAESPFGFLYSRLSSTTQSVLRESTNT